MKKLIIALMIVFLISLASGETQSLGTFRQNECINLIELGSGFDSCTISSVMYPNSSLTLNGVLMTKDGNQYNYTFCQTNDAGEYIVNGYCSQAGYEDLVWSYDFKIKSNSLFYLYFLYALAIIFFISTLFVDEEFLIYVSGVFFLIGGVYIMINGVDYVNDFWSRAIAYVSIGIGMLFTIGAYTFNKYTRAGEGDEEE